MGNVRHYLLIKVADSISSPSGLITFSFIRQFLQLIIHHQQSIFYFTVTILIHLHTDIPTTPNATLISQQPIKLLSIFAPTSSTSPPFCEHSETPSLLATLDCIVVIRLVAPIVFAIILAPFNSSLRLNLPLVLNGSDEIQGVPSRSRLWLTLQRSLWLLELLLGP
jgi:hypothetical protein